MAFSIGSSLVNATGSGLKMPGIPTIGTITLSSANAASMAFTPGLPPGFTYSVTTTPTGGTGSSTVSPISIAGLTGNKSYTFTLTAYRMTLSKSATSGSYLTKPEAVTIGTVTSLEITTASVGYTAPTGGAAKYEITTSPAGGTGNTIVGLNPIPVTGLAGNTSYTFTITASNATGSTTSTSTSYLTKPTIVTIGAVSSITSSGASVAYTYATGNAATYTITTTPSGGTGTGASPISVTGLAANTSYTFTVTASNATGSNASTSGSYVTKPGNPTLGTITVTGLTASVGFTAPTGGATTYVVYTSPVGGTGSSTTSPISVTGLSANTTYSFVIYASNAAGTSSMISSGSTYLTRPDAPTIGTVTVTSSTQVSIPFTIVGTTSNITSIAITSSPSITLTYTTTAPTFSGQSATIAVTGTFIVGIPYKFFITITNSNGTSALSTASNSVIPLDIMSYSNDGSTLSGWTNATGDKACLISNSTGNNAPSIQVGSNCYAYYNLGFSLLNTIITFDVYTTNLCNFYFACDSLGAGQMFRLETRSASYSNFATTPSWTSWTAPVNGPTLSSNTWYTIKIVITSSGVCFWYSNGVLQYNNWNLINNGNYIGFQGDGLGGGYFDNLTITQMQPNLIPIAPLSVLSNCCLWFDANDPLTFAGAVSAVTGLVDKSGIGNNALTLSQRATIITSGTTMGATILTNIFNGLPVLYLNCTGFRGTITPSYTGTAFSFFIVATVLTNTNPLAYCRLLSVGNTPDTGDANDDSTDPSKFTIFLGGTNYFLKRYNSNSIAAYTYSIPSIISGYFDGTNQYFYKDGSLVDSQAHNSSNLTLTTFGIGTNSNNTTIFNMDQAYYGEVLMYKSSPTSSQRQSIEGYLATKWKLQPNLPSTHTYYSGSVAFYYTGKDQTYIIPSGKTTMTVKVWGAGGGAQGHGSISAYAGGSGGGGGYASATFTVTSGTVYNIIVGQGGRYGDNAAASPPTYGGGGGESIGGDGHWGTASGGGRSAVQLSISSTYTDIITAGGGGGAGNNTYNDASTIIGSGGAGGGASDNKNGGDGIGASTEGGKGGTQTAGGTGTYPGSKYTGGGSTTSTWYNAGGGGGWYGGSAGESYGGYYFGGGGGGSSYVDTTYSQSGTSVFLGGSGATVGNGSGLPSGVAGTIGNGATPVRGALKSTIDNNGQNGYIILLIS